MKLIHILFILTMLAFAILQLNDSDRLVWISIYLASALMVFFALIEACNPCVRAWAIMLCILSLILMVQVFPGVITFLQTSDYQEIYAPITSKKSYIEQTREFLGLLIVMLYCIYVAFSLRKNTHTDFKQ